VNFLADYDNWQLPLKGQFGMADCFGMADPIWKHDCPLRKCDCVLKVLNFDRLTAVTVYQILSLIITFLVLDAWKGRLTSCYSMFSVYRSVYCGENSHMMVLWDPLLPLLSLAIPQRYSSHQRQHRTINIEYGPGT
jgi:hypothetical protein